MPGRATRRRAAFALLAGRCPAASPGTPLLCAAAICAKRRCTCWVAAPWPKRLRPARPLKRRNTLRVMTYNVHSCVGMDGRLSTSRIARIIAQCRPDIVALQELDVGRGRTGGIDQAHAIAQELEMEFHFHPGPAAGGGALRRCHSQPLADEADQGRPAADDLQPPGPGAARRVVGERLDRGAGVAARQHAPGAALQGAAAASASPARARIGWAIPIAAGRSFCAATSTPFPPRPRIECCARDCRTPSWP